MGKGRFVNQKLGKRVHRGIDRRIWKSKTEGFALEPKRDPGRHQTPKKSGRDIWETSKKSGEDT